MNRFGENIFYNFRGYLKENKSKLLYISMVSFFCVCLGIYFGLVEFDFLDILKRDDGILFDMVRGETDLMYLFWGKILECFCILLILVLFNLHYFFSFLNYLFISYQSIVFGATCISIIGNYSIQGVFCVLLILPINIMIFFIIINLIIILQGRAKFAYRYNIRFIDSINYLHTPKRIGVCVVGFVLVCLIYAVVFGILLKSFVFSIY